MFMQKMKLPFFISTGLVIAVVGVVGALAANLDDEAVFLTAIPMSGFSLFVTGTLYVNHALRSLSQFTKILSWIYWVIWLLIGLSMFGSNIANNGYPVEGGGYIELLWLLFNLGVVFPYCIGGLIRAQSVRRKLQGNIVNDDSKNDDDD